MDRAAVDLCGTIAEVRRLTEEVLGLRSDPSVYTIPGVTREFFAANPWIFQNAEPVPGSVGGVWELARRYEIIYLSARPESAKKATEEWLARRGLPPGRLILSENKPAVVCGLDIKVAVDDAPHEIKKLNQVCRVLVPAAPYNRGMGERFAW